LVSIRVGGGVVKKKKTRGKNPGISNPLRNSPVSFRGSFFRHLQLETHGLDTIEIKSNQILYSLKTGHN
jgi:hypothetical protein